MIVAVASAFSSPPLADIAAAKIAAIISPTRPIGIARRDERREHVVDVVVALIAGRLLDEVGGARPDVPDARVAGQKCLAVVARRRVAALGDRRVELLLQRGVLRGLRARGHLRVVRTVEQHRRRLKEIEDEHEHAAAEDQQLQRNLDEARSSAASGGPRRSTSPSGSAAPGSDRSRNTRGSETARRSSPTRTCRSRAGRT